MNPYILQLELKGYNDAEIAKFKEIFKALITSGGLQGVKNGKTILHFNGNGDFMGVELQYFPWRKRDLLDKK